jgi:4-hydroxy-tetrahydrodipicolinate synthase
MPTAPQDSKFGTVHVPTVTPFDDGGVDADAIGDLVDFLVDGGVDGLVPCGTTGEFASLDADEYETVVAATVDAAGDDASVLPGAGATSVSGTLDRLDTAADCGADAALVVLPYYHGQNAPGGNEEFLRAVLDETPLPVVLYNIPSCVGQSMDADLVTSVADHPDVVGMKDTSGDLTHLLDIVRLTGDDFHLFQGYDSQLVPAVSMGATGGINALANVVPEAVRAAIDAAAEGDLDRAREVQLEYLAPFFAECVDRGFAPATKAALVARGVLDDDAVRPPLVELDEAGVEPIRAAVDRTVDAFAD